MRRLTAILCLTLAVLLVSTGVSWGADFQKGLDAHNKRDYATALREWTPFAEQGDAIAQFIVGDMYRRGRGVPQNLKTAVKWYTFAAEQGFVYAQTYLGYMYRWGLGVPKDYKTAVKWWTRAAEQGNAYAQRNLEALQKKLKRWRKFRETSRWC